MGRSPCLLERKALRIVKVSVPWLPIPTSDGCHEVLTISPEEGAVRVDVTRPDGDRELPLGEVERVAVDHPLAHYMPLTGQRMMKLGLQPWDNKESVPRWLPRAYEGWDGSHRHDVLESGIDPHHSTVGFVRAYDISTPFDARTSLAAAKELGRPHTLYLISLLGSHATEGIDLTVITTRMGYDDERVANVLCPRDKPGLAERAFDMFSLANESSDEEVVKRHLARVALLATTNAMTTRPLSLMVVDEAFLYMSHD